ncbi:hypothetical protein PZA11_000649 [Diplocarpon coronariae]|nr:hypothetical protein JHW43_005300 [Diplocarpon mali]
MFFTTAIFFAILPLGIATSCTTSGAEEWPANNDFTGAPFLGNTGAFGGAQDVAGCASYCKQDQSCVTKCLALIMQGQCNAVGGSACEDSTGTGSSISNPADDFIKKFRRRAVLDCTGSETCYQYNDGSLLCVDLGTGLYHDDADGNGSLVDGTYTADSGQVQTGTETPADIATKTATTARRASAAPTTALTAADSTRISAAVDTATTAPTRTSASAATQTSAVATSATSNAAIALQQAGPVVGALGLIVGLVL